VEKKERRSEFASKECRRIASCDAIWKISKQDKCRRNNKNQEI